MVLAMAASLAVCGALSAPAAATFPGQDGRIAYVKHRIFFDEGGSDEPPKLDSVPSVYTMNPDGSGRQRLASAAHEPRFSPAGDVVAFEDFLERIFIKPVSAGRRSGLAPRLGIAAQVTPAWSPTGDRLVFALERSHPRDALYLHTIRRDGTALHRLRAGVEPDWSVKDRIVFDAGERIATMAPGGGRLRRLRVGGWSPDGRWVVFTRPLSRERSGIAVIRADGSHLRTLTRGPWDGSPVWSPEGRQIAYVHRNREKAREKIVVMRTDGKARRSLLTLRRHPQLQDYAVLLKDLDWQPLRN